MQQAIQMVINVMPDGKIGVVGPLHDKIFCLGLLEIVKDIVKKHKVEESILLARPLQGGMKGN